MGWFPGKRIFRVLTQKFMEESIIQEATQCSSPNSAESQAGGRQQAADDETGKPQFYPEEHNHQQE